MMVSPTNQQEWATMSLFLKQHAGVHPSGDLKMIGWVAEGELKIVVGLNGWIGQTCQIHLAFAPGWTYSPKEMLKEVFNYAFNTAKRDMLIGIVNSQNVSAMRMDFHLGFTELFRLPALHDYGGDIVVLGMTREQCKYLNYIEQDGKFVQFIEVAKDASIH